MALDNWILAGSSVPNDAIPLGYFKEQKESGKETYAHGNSSATRVFLCCWNCRAAFVDDVLGYAYLDGSNTLHRVLPDPHPDLYNFWAGDATIEGIGTVGVGVNGAIAFPTAKVTVNYRPFPYRFLADAFTGSEINRYVSRQYAFNADYLTVNGTMKFVTPVPPTVLTAPPGRITGTMELTLTWHEVPGKATNPFEPPNIENVIDCYGRVNDSDFDGYDAGTVLFMGIDPQMSTPRLAGDNFYWTIAMKFLIRDNGAGIGGETAGHQYLYDVANARWDLVTSDGLTGGPRIYQEADLNSLFVIT